MLHVSNVCRAEYFVIPTHLYTSHIKHTHTRQELMNPIPSRLVTPIPTPIKTRPFEFPTTSRLATKTVVPHHSDEGGVSVNLAHSQFINSELSDKPLDSTRHEPKRYTCSAD